MKILSIASFVVGFSLFAGIPQSVFADGGMGADQQALENDLLSEAPKVTPFSIQSPLPLEWEKKHPERVMWSDYAYDVINQYFDELNEADDMVNFCPNYPTLTHDQQVQAWAQLFVGVSKWESSWDPTERTLEGSDIDPQTGLEEYSEGLLQLSYQDQLYNPYCHFDWQSDKQLSSSDQHRTIWNPYNNLYCGIRIMADAIRDNVNDPNDKICSGPEHKIACNEYWSTLGQSGMMHSKIKSITAEMHNTLPFCGKHMHGNIFLEDFTKFANLKGNREVVKVWRWSEGEIEKPFKKKHAQPGQSDQQPSQEQAPAAPAAAQPAASQ